MHRRLVLLLGVSLLALTVFSGLAPAAPISIGLLFFDSGDPSGTAGVFDIANQTGPNGTPLPDTTFPVTTTVGLSDFVLAISFLDGGFATLGPSDFLSDGSGGFTGNSVFSLTASPIASAILTGSLSPLNLTLNDGRGLLMFGTFSATIVPSSGSSLQIGDFGVLSAEAVPEPASLSLLGAGVAALVLFRRRSLSRAVGRIASTRTLLVLMLLAAVQSLSWAQVRLNTTAQPATGNAGVTVANLTGSGFPAGVISPASVAVSLATTCNGAAAATTTPSTLVTVVGSMRRVGFTIPASTPAGTYAVSVNGVTSTGASFNTASCSALTVQAADRFVRSSGGRLMFNGFPFRFGGTNAVSPMLSSHATIDQMLQTAVDKQLKVIRMWAFYDIGVPGPDTQFYLQYWNGSAPAYNDTETGMANFDYVVYRAGQLNLKLIIALTNNWRDLGGMDQYVRWLGGQYHDQFYTDMQIRQWYKDWINHVLTRVNSVSGLAYKDDPAILAWELANEPRCAGSGPGSGGLPSSGACTTQTLLNWIADVAPYIKNVDPNHLVAVGDEGFYCLPGTADWITNCSTGVDSLAFSQSPGIDLVGFHLYPEGWGRNLAWTEAFIDQHLADGVRLGKPAFLGEYGLLAGNARNVIYKAWMDRTLISGGAGALFWDLGAGQPSPSAAEANGAFNLRDGSPLLLTMKNFGQMMASNTVLPFPPVAGSQWATAPFEQPVTLAPLNNDVAYAGAMIDPNSIDLDPDTPGQQTTAAVYGGTFDLAGQNVQFTPAAGFNGAAQGSYTVQDNYHRLSNRGYLFVNVSPSQLGALTMESFETGTGGWAPMNVNLGTVAQATAFPTDGNHTLQVDVTAAGWFGVTLPATVDVSGRSSLSIDVQSTGAGGGAAMALQSGAGWTWCETPAPWAPLATNTLTTLTAPLDATSMTCYGTPDYSQLRTVWVYLTGPGVYYLDFLRAAPPTNPATSVLLYSFENGTDGWAAQPGHAASGTVTQTTAFSTNGTHAAQLDVTTSDWFGLTPPTPLNLAANPTLKFDVGTNLQGTSMNVALQDTTWRWCQGAWGWVNAATPQATVTVDLTQLGCGAGGPPDLTQIHTLYVFFSPGTFYLDNVRAQ